MVVITKIGRIHEQAAFFRQIPGMNLNHFTFIVILNTNNINKSFFSFHQLAKSIFWKNRVMTMINAPLLCFSAAHTRIKWLAVPIFQFIFLHKILSRLIEQEWVLESHYTFYPFIHLFTKRCSCCSKFRNPPPPNR